MKNAVAVLLVGFGGLLSLSSLTLGAEQPNIVIILADDLGWGDPQCYNADSKIATPNMNRLAAEGIKFTAAHTPSSVCTPTRYGLLTGRYCWRSRLKSSVLDGFSPPLIESSRVTIASFLKQQGYSTACIGKWHLGMQWTRRDGAPESDDRAAKGFRSGDTIDFSKPITGGPLAVGFDHFFGISASLDMPPYCWIKDDRCWPPPTTVVPTARDTIFLNQTGGAADPAFQIDEVLPELKDHAVSWLKSQRGSSKPFFLYLPLNSPHLPVAPSEPFRGKSGAGDYGDFVMETDDCVGAVLSALSEIEQDENTLVLFTSDNGGLWHQWDPSEADDVQSYRPTPRGKYTKQFGHQSNARLRGTKADIWEGGHRVPFMVRWPGKVAAGQTCDQVIELNDVLATIAHVTQTPLPEGAGQDSRDFHRLLEGSKKPVRRFAIHHSLRGEFAIRQGNWKLIRNRGSGGFSLPRKLVAKEREPRGQLYDLAQDPSETQNRWNENPQLVDRMTIALGDVVDPLPREKVQFISTADQSLQEAILIQPDSATEQKTLVPMVVSLHSWSADLNQRNVLEQLVHERGWIYLFPNFRGVNQTPAACGSALAQQDILDAVDWAIEHRGADPDCVFLTGTSGGGHMTMMMSARNPKRWRAASAWVGISDLASWYEKHQGSKYGNMLESVCGGTPTSSPKSAAEYKLRSPLGYLAAAGNVALDLSAGVHDGHTGSVPVRHSIDAFNEIAKANHTATVSQSEIEQLMRPNGRLEAPISGDEGFDRSFGRDYYMRRTSDKARLTIFEGGHEGIGTATMRWFEKHLGEPHKDADPTKESD
ncbi:MAG: sulfatase-like hydrolase/transferase [Rubripirellula sp.]